jgi:hypothetical protein
MLAEGDHADHDSFVADKEAFSTIQRKIIPVGREFGT